MYGVYLGFPYLYTNFVIHRWRSTSQCWRAVLVCCLQSVMWGESSRPSVVSGQQKYRVTMVSTVSRLVYFSNQQQIWHVSIGPNSHLNVGNWNRLPIWSHCMWLGDIRLSLQLPTAVHESWCTARLARLVSMRKARILVTKPLFLKSCGQDGNGTQDQCQRLNN